MVLVLSSGFFPEIPSHPLDPGRSQRGKEEVREGPEPSPPSSFALDLAVASEGSPAARLRSLAIQAVFAAPRGRSEGVGGSSLPVVTG